MKSPEYVFGVVRAFRTLLDEGRNATPEELSELAKIFSRGGFTDGYYTGKIDRRMLGVRSEDDKQNTRALPKWADGGNVTHRKLPVMLEATLRRDEPSVLTATCGAKTVTVTGDIPQIARKESAAMTEESVAGSLCKLLDLLSVLVRTRTHKYVVSHFPFVASHSVCCYCLVGIAEVGLFRRVRDSRCDVILLFFCHFFFTLHAANGQSAFLIFSCLGR